MSGVFAPSEVRRFQFVGPSGEIMLGERELAPPTLYDFPEPGVPKLRPIVAGLAALVKSHEPGLSNDQIVTRIRATADNIDRANPGFAGKLGTGRANAARALGVDLPPAPVEGLQAADTAGDQGGSVTLRWDPSADDGGGADDVTGYTVGRSRSVGGPFSELASLAAGTDSYDDVHAANHTNYYYVVTTRDAAGQTSASEPAGPTSARDDTPPPAVSNVAAADEPGDSGGAIRVGWSAYAATTDFAAFRVYRSELDFITVSAMTPLAAVTDAGATSYLDATTADGVDYWYAVTAVDGEPNEITDVQAAGPVQSFANTGITVNPGLHFMATPIVPQNPDPAAFFGVAPRNLDYARWDPTAQGGSGQYVYYQMAPTEDLTRLALGRGFWFRNAKALVLQPEGAIAPSGPFGIDLEPGWRQIGNPFLAAVDFTAATVEEGSVARDLRSAEAAGIMSRYAWAFDPATQDYSLIDSVVGGSRRLVAPWEGVWVWVQKPCRLVLDRETTATASDATAATAVAPQWQVRLVARSGTRTDAANFIGVAAQPERLEVASPPAFGPGVRLDLTCNGGPRSAVFKRPSGGAVRWTFTVTADAPGEVTVATPDLSPIPPEYSVVLTDLDANAQTPLRTVPSYRYTATSAGERHFALTVKPSGAALVVSSLSTTPTRQGGAEVRFTLTADANCDVEVLNVAGRVVRRLASSKDYAAGQQVIPWNGRNESGLAAPNGLYLIRVRARSSAGSTTNALSRATLMR